MEGHKLASHLWEAERKPEGRACGAGPLLPWLDGVGAGMPCSAPGAGGEKGASLGPLVFIRHYSESAREHLPRHVLPGRFWKAGAPAGSCMAASSCALGMVFPNLPFPGSSRLSTSPPGFGRERDMQEFLTLCRMSRSPRVSEASRGKTQFLSQLAVAVRKLHVEGSDVGHL